MKPPSEQWCVEIDVTNKCSYRCSNCTHLTKHGGKWEMTTKQFRQAVASLKYFPGFIGMIGGEPQQHSEFIELCRIMRDILPKKKCAIFTSTPNDALGDIFGYVSVNKYKNDCLHQPVLVARKDFGYPDVPDYCWLQDKWSSSITPNGFYFCEVAGAIAGLLGIKGLPVSTDCWRQDMGVYLQQARQLCKYCGIALDLRSRKANDILDDASMSWGHLKDICVHTDLVELFDGKVLAHKYLSWWQRVKIWVGVNRL